MSDFLAEGLVVVRPDTTKFRAQLEAQLKAIKIAPFAIPIAAAGAGLVGAASATAVLTAAQKTAEKSTLGLASVTQFESSALGKQAVILQAVTSETLALAGAQDLARRAGGKSTASLLGAGSATAKLDAALLGLRTAVGSTAVIGLGALALAAIAAGKAISASIKNFAAFQQELATFRVTAGATAEQMRAVSEQAARLGADVRLPAVSASDAAVAMTELAKAGLTVEEAMAGAEGVLQLATAAQISNADAAQITAGALNSFGLAGDQAVRVADDLANAANAAQGSIADFGLALQQVEAVGRQVGLSLEDTTSILTLLAKNGLRGSDAGTSLRVALLRLVAPTKQANAVIKQLGINIRDAEGNVRPDVFAQFAQATSALGPALRDALTALVFGQDAIRAVAIAGREGASGLQLMRFEIDQQGTAAALAAARTEGLAGSLSAAQSTAQNLSIELGGLISPILINLSGAFVDTAGAAQVLIDKIVDFNTKQKQVFEDSVPGGSKALEILGGVLKTVFVPGFGLSQVTKGLHELIVGADEAAAKIQRLQEDMNLLQQARIFAQGGGATAGAAFLTKEINKIREEIKKLKIEAGQVVPPQTESEKNVIRLSKAWAIVSEAKQKALSKNQDTSGFDKVLLSIQGKLDNLFKGQKLEEQARTTFEGLGKALQSSLTLFTQDPTAQASTQIIAGLQGLIRKITALGPEAGAAAQKIGRTILASIRGAIQAAVSAGDTQSANALKKYADSLAAIFEGNLKDAFSNIKVPLIGDQIAKALQPSGTAVAKAQATGGDVIGELEKRRQDVQDLIDSKRVHGADLEDLYNEITSINAQISGIEQNIVDEEEKRQKDKTDVFEKGLAAALLPKERLLVRAAANESLKDDIKFREAIIAILNNQIAQIRKVLGNTEAARDLIKGIQDRILVETNKLKTDRKNFLKQLHDALVARLERAQRGIELDIELADINENTKRRISLREKLIQQLKRERKKLHLTGNALKENRNEIARINAEIKDIKGETDDTGKRFKELTFSFLQTQQGFAANLLGNLIPGFATGGLVGGTQGAAGDPLRQVSGGFEQPRGGIQTESALAGSRDRGVRPVQVDTTNHLLRSILRALQHLNGRASHPEARYQNRVSGSNMDMIGGV